MIAVFGATGNTGRATVKELLALGENPLCIVRNSDKAREVLGEDVRTALADVTDRSAMERALKGVKSVFVVTGHNPDADKQQINILEAAKAAGANYFVKVSGGKAIVGPNAESVVGRGHYAVEEAVKKQRPALDDPAPRLVHAEHVRAGGVDQERRQDDHAVPGTAAAGVHRRARHRRARRARAARPGQARGQSHRVHRCADQSRRIREGLLAGTRQARHLRRCDRSSRPRKECVPATCPIGS